MSTAAHVPPQNIEAEESVLGAMLVAEPALTRVIDEVKLNAEDFYLDKHRIIFSCVHDLYAESKPVDELSVCHALAQRRPIRSPDGRMREAIEVAGGKHYVSELAAKVPAAGNAKHYAEIVQQNALLRRVDGGVKQAAETFANRNGESPVELWAQIRALIDEVKPPAVGEPSSWARVDLSEALTGEGAEAAPTILQRIDGPCLLYDGRLHQVSAEPEAGKSWLGLQAAADLLGVGCIVLYIDFESTAAEIVGRLQALGVDGDRILDQFIYLRPHEPLSDATRADFEAGLAQAPALVVIDGATEALTIHGLDLSDNADIARWLELLPRPAARSGAAVLLVDHVVKNKEARGRYAIGAQHKLAGIDVAYALEVVEPFGRGQDGKVRLKVMKDRPGHVRQFADGDDVAMVNLHSDADTGAVRITLDSPEPEFGDDEFRPTILMERISRAVEASPGMTTREIRGLGGKTQAVDQARRLLVSEGFIDVKVEGSAHCHYPLQDYRSEDDEGGLK